jgi:hypothetical protein
MAEPVDVSSALEGLYHTRVPGLAEQVRVSPAAQEKAAEIAEERGLPAPPPLVPVETRGKDS